MLTDNAYDTSMALSGAAALDPNVAASGTYVAVLIVSNDSAASVTTGVVVPLPVGAASMAVVGTDTGTITGTASGGTTSGAVALDDTLVLPAYTEWTYTITVTLGSGLGTSSCIAYLQVVGEAVRRMEAADPIRIGVIDLNHAIEDRNTFQLTQAMHKFFAVPENPAVQYMLDRLENADDPFTFPDFLRSVDENLPDNTPVAIPVSGATYTLTSKRFQEIILSANCVISFPVVTEGMEIILKVTGAFTVTWGTGEVSNASTPPTYASPSMFRLTTTDGAGAAWLVTLDASTIG